MKTTVLLVLTCLTVATWAQQYTTKFDNVNLDQILSNQRLLRSYVNCLLGKQKCTPDGEELKKILPDALKTQCSKCNQKQEAGARKVIRHLIKNHSDWWKELEAVYDKMGIYRKRYEAELRKEGVSL